MIDATNIPRLQYDDAVRVGRRLCNRFLDLLGAKPPIAADEAWADVTQFVLRHARAVELENMRKQEAEASDAAQ